MQSTQCLECKHYEGLAHCAAFGDEKQIPQEIMEGSHDHREPFPGDHGIRWEARWPGHPILDEDEDEDDGDE